MWCEALSSKVIDALYWSALARCATIPQCRPAEPNIRKTWDLNRYASAMPAQAAAALQSRNFPKAKSIMCLPLWPFRIWYPIY